MKEQKFSVAGAVRDNYPEYWNRGIQTYPADQCAPFCKVTDRWGLFSNFGDTPIEVEGVRFKNSEQLFQILKFTSHEAVADILAANGQKIKMKAKKWNKICARADWGSMLVEAMKFAITTKYEQNAAFREALESSKGFYIVEDQTSFPGTTANTWGAKLIDGNFVGPNLMGQLLMELRDSGPLLYSLPEDAFDLIKATRGI
ncbi:MAG: NADAR family protein [Bacteroidales bacterium]|nr:NADAR family protein [Bacteroidales bacterium]